MQDLFKGLENLGFNNLKKVEVFGKKPTLDENVKPVEEKKIITEEDFLYKKIITCPICGNEFEERIVKKTKLRAVSYDFDLKPNFEHINPLIYDIFMCDKCGYTAMNRFFDKIWGKRAEFIEEQVTPKFKPREYPFVLSLDDALERYKLALYNAVVKKAVSSEKAYICMKLGWLYRAKKDEENEKLFLKNARAGLIEAYETEHMPICDMNEHTVAFLIAAFSKIIGNSEEALRWVSPIILSRTAMDRTKQRALDLKHEIQKDIEALKKKSEKA